MSALGCTELDRLRTQHHRDREQAEQRQRRWRSVVHRPTPVEPLVRFADAAAHAQRSELPDASFPGDDAAHIT
ncbi:MAG: hypothetical protein E6575_22300 [Bradyrhizobium sp.]|jgi:hypothetical protein|nr:hypothetical protein [Bradyrhizobium sp.]